MSEQQPECPEETNPHWDGNNYYFSGPDGVFIALGMAVQNKRNPAEWLALSRDNDGGVFYPIDALESEEEARVLVELHFRHWPPKFEDAQPTELESLRARLAEAEAMVAMMTVVDGELSIALDRASKAEARASAGEAKLERVKALLDGVGPVVSDLAQLRDAAHSVSDGDWKLDQSISGITTESGLCDIGFDLARWDAEFMVSAFNNLPALLSAISEVREVLKGE